MNLKLIAASALFLSATVSLGAAQAGSLSGLASWYGSESGHGLTASGARFSPNGYTAAHRTLPFGTRVRVTNQRNGRSVVVTINDRGPFVAGRVIDLSRASARAIGLGGVAPVYLSRL